MRQIKFLAIIALATVIAFTALSLTGCDTGDGGGGGGETPDIASFAGTWNASGGRSIVFIGNTFNYTVNNATRYSGTFTVTGSDIFFYEYSSGLASAHFQLSSNTLTLSNHTVDSGVNGIYTKGSGSGGGGEDETTVITLPRNTDPEQQPPEYDDWQYLYDIPSSITGGKITAGDVYTFTYSFKSNVTITDGIWIGIRDNSETATPQWWNELSDSYLISGISANATVSGTITLIATGTASAETAEANRLQFVVNPHTNAPSEPTLTFTTFTLVKISGGGPSDPNAVYKYEKDGSTYKISKGGSQTLADILNAIRNAANGAACTIQFGDLSGILDIGNIGLDFNNNGGTWGLINLIGKIKAAVDKLINISGNISINSTADIENTYNGGVAIYNGGTGTVKINGGRIKAGPGGYAVQNGGGGTVNIDSGATIDGDTSGGVAIDLNGTWNSTGGRVIVFSGNNFTYKVNNVTEYAGTFTVTGSTMTFYETMHYGGMSATSQFSLTAGTFYLLSNTWDSTVTGTYTKDSGGGGVPSPPVNPPNNSNSGGDGGLSPPVNPPNDNNSGGDSGRTLTV